MKGVGDEGDIDSGGNDRSNHVEDFNGGNMRAQQLTVEIPVLCDDVSDRFHRPADLPDDILDPAIGSLARPARPPVLGPTDPAASNGAVISCVRCRT